MDASSLNKKISFVTVVSNDPATDAPIESTLIDYAWANVSYKQVSEGFKNDLAQRVFLQHPIFTVRKNLLTQAVTSADTIKFEGKRYAIVSIVEIYDGFLTFEGEQTK